MMRYSILHCTVLVLLLNSNLVQTAAASDWKPIDSALLSKTGPSVEKDADIEAKTRRGATPLFVSSQDGRYEIVKLLLEHGADVKMKTNDGLSPLLAASIRGHAEIVRLLLDNGADVNQKTNQGTTSLMIASANGHTDVVKVLLDKGADTSLKNESGKSATEVAANDEIRNLISRISKL